MSCRVLIVDDEKDMATLIERILASKRDCETLTAVTGIEALELLSVHEVDLILADLIMPEMDGLTLLDKIRDRWPDKTVVMITAYGSIQTAVDAMRRGAYDYLTKPFDYDSLLLVVDRALERVRLLNEKKFLHSALNAQAALGGILGTSEKMRRVFETIRNIGPTLVPVLIAGESGTGKEMAARAIHSESRRNERHFVAVNCAALPESIAESEFFGYVRGAFTGALHDKRGLIEEADGGTLFLDEIGDLSLHIQAKLLRVLQDGEFRSVGDVKKKTADIRVVSASNKNLEKEIAKGNFREDLYYRLNVVTIKMPSLAERKEDIPILTAHFIRKYSETFGKKCEGIAPHAVFNLMEREWKGNVRELENTIARAVALSNRKIIDERDFFEEAQDEEVVDFMTARKKAVLAFYRSYISTALARNNGNVSKTAEECLMKRQSLQQVMKRCGIDPSDFRQGPSRQP
jgi:DNA-binding NtrC family response regulator